MFKIRFQTTVYRPDLQVTIRNSIDGWNHDLPGIYQNDEWRFELAEENYPNGMEFKFVLERSYWMAGINLFLHPAAGGDYVFSDTLVHFPPITEAIVESSHFQQMFFQPNLDEERIFDAIVIGSGIGGGIVADQLSDMGADVLVLEAGSLQFLTHTANLPRQHQVGKFDKHIWGLFDELKVINYVNAPGSFYGGGQAFNLGGRSVFWGGFIPRMTWWELEPWPESIRWYLEDSGYQRAEDLMFWPAPPALYQNQVKTLLQGKWPDYNHFDAPMAVRNLNPSAGTIAAGLFSTADLLSESKLTVDSAGNQHLSINLNHAVVRLETAENRITNVVAHDLLVDRIRSFKARQVILSAGTIESPKIVKMSGLANPNGLAGMGLTDHPIFFTHFSIPQGKTWHRTDTSSKILSRHKQASSAAHPYNMLLELGADLNQGRYLDADILARHRLLKGNAMLCEIVFLFNSPLLAGNRLDHDGPPYTKPVITMHKSPSADAHWAEVNALKDQVIAELGGEALPGADLALIEAGLGGVAHEVGTLRLGAGNSGVVDENLKYNTYDNLYVCDLSVFPTAPAANPTLTLAALSLRLADRIKSLL
jgi:choline dehydrogenase-like flavoprotein